MHKDEYTFATAIRSAWVMTAEDPAPDPDNYDVGMVRTSIQDPFFELGLLPNANIAPICLAAVGADFIDKKITGVGWGDRYDEFPRPEPQQNRKPKISSCMTNKIGPISWKFQSCDMRLIKKNNWSCNVKIYPYKYDVNQCRKYFEEAERAVAMSFPDRVEEFKSVHKIHIEFPSKSLKLSPYKTVCYRDKIFKQVGWCRVRGSDTGWGFCSPSCDPSIMQVRFPKYSILISNNEIPFEPLAKCVISHAFSRIRFHRLT